MDKKYTYASRRMQETHQKYAKQSIPKYMPDQQANRLHKGAMKQALVSDPNRVQPNKVKRVSQSASARMQQSHEARAHMQEKAHEKEPVKASAKEPVKAAAKESVKAAAKEPVREPVKALPKSVNRVQPERQVPKRPDAVRKPVKKKRKKRPRWLMVVLPIAVVLLAVLLFLAIKVSSVKTQADHIKTDLEQLLDHVGDKDVKSAEVDLANSYQHCDALEASLDGPFWSTASKIPLVKKELDAGRDLIAVLHVAQDKLIAPLLTLMKEKPMTGLKVGDNGFNVRLIISYLDFVETIHPELLALTEQIENINTDSFTGGFIGKYKKKLLSYMETYTKASEYLPVVRAFLGNGEDKVYLLVAQNSAEIRASGGFPGSIGTIEINHGLLTIGDFKSVYKILSGAVSAESEVTVTEENLFGSWIEAPRDACFIPAFDRAAKIWAVGYEDYQRQNGAQDHAVGDGGDDSYEESWDDPYSEDWYDEPYQAVYDPSSYESRLVFYATEYGSGNTDQDEASGSYGAASPDTASDEDYNIGAYTRDGSVFYSYNNDFYGYGSYETEYVKYVDGVVSLTPAIIQMLLSQIGEITLSDGSVLDGNNATKVLQYDLYHKYFDEATITSSSNRKSDKLFAETAKKVMKEFVASFEVSKFTEYYDLFKKGAEDHIIMMWMKDAEQEALLDKIGLSGKLNNNPDNPEAGVYFSLADPSKMGWYLNINTFIDDVPVINYDGTRTYDVSVTLTNVIDEQDILASGEYIIGAYNGGIRGYVHFFGPAGGTISDFDVPEDMYVFEGTYKDLDVGYNLDMLIAPGQSIEVNYKITTAPFVEKVPKVITTPTLTEYR